MKKNSIVATAALGLLTLGMGTFAMAASPTATSTAAARTNEADVTLKPGSDTLRLHFSGAQIITQESAGGLMIVKARGRLLHYRPEAYQVIDGEVKPVEVHFHIEGTDQVVVQFGKIDKSAPVILKQGAVMSNQQSLM